MSRKLWVWAGLGAAALAAFGVVEALAQAPHPFAVGAREAGAPESGLAAWLLAKQSEFHRQLAGGVRARA